MISRLGMIEKEQALFSNETETHPSITGDLHECILHCNYFLRWLQRFAANAAPIEINVSSVRYESLVTTTAEQNAPV